MNAAEYARMRDLEDWYWWFVAKRSAAARFVADAAPSNSRLRILDAGCGTGAMLDLFRRWPNVDATGIDSSEEALQFTRSRGHESLVAGDLTGLPFPAETFDVVTALDVIEHIDDDQHALCEIRRVLKPGGILVATVPAYQFLWSRHDEALHHKRRYTGGAFKRLLVESGLEVERQTYRLAAVFPLAAAARVLTRRRRSDECVESEVAETNVPSLPGFVNSALIRFHALEVAIGRRVPLPFGLSILSVARKPAHQGTRLGA